MVPSTGAAYAVLTASRYAIKIEQALPLRIILENKSRGSFRRHVVAFDLAQRDRAFYVPLLPFGRRFPPSPIL
jgi:hypothetical protein